MPFPKYFNKLKTKSEDTVIDKKFKKKRKKKVRDYMA